ncbi:uncharacterized protein ermn [Spinachia spinachia]
METETSPLPPKAGKDALAPRLPELGVGGAALGALGDREERDAWSPGEEGDDSVFYSDEDRAPEETQAAASSGLGRNAREPDEDETAEGEGAEAGTDAPRQGFGGEARRELQKPRSARHRSAGLWVSGDGALHAQPQKGSFDHLSPPSKYGTVSYRKIRRGNTRQKIEDFEHMMVNL